MNWKICMAFAVLISGVVVSQPAVAQLDYQTSLGGDFYDTYPQVPDPVNVFLNGLPSSPIFGASNEWELQNPATGGSASLLATGGAPFSGQNGWCIDDNGGCQQPPNGDPISYFGSNWQPGVTLPVANGLMNGHGPQQIAWTAPPDVNEGGISIVGALEQLFEQTRQMRLSIFKNGAGTPEFMVDAQPPTVNGVLLNQVNFGPVDIAVQPGDELLFVMDGSGAEGNGTSTFIAWDVSLREIIIPEPTTASLVATLLLGLAALRRRN